MDLLITGGTIVDGTGAPARSGELAIHDGRIREVRRGEQPPPAARTIDARGKVVAPGFIDLHSHAALMILADPDHGAKARQGVTTELVGVDGLSYAPFPDRADLEAMIEMNAGLDGDPRDAEGARGTSGRGRPVTVDWATVEGALARYDSGTAVNVAQLVGNEVTNRQVLGNKLVALMGPAIEPMVARGDAEGLRRYLARMVMDPAIGGIVVTDASGATLFRQMRSASPPHPIAAWFRTASLGSSANTELRYDNVYQGLLTLHLSNDVLNENIGILLFNVSYLFLLLLALDLIATQLIVRFLVAPLGPLATMAKGVSQGNWDKDFMPPSGAVFTLRRDEHDADRVGPDQRRRTEVRREHPRRGDLGAERSGADDEHHDGQ